jgi:hypothetical protein
MGKKEAGGNSKKEAGNQKKQAVVAEKEAKANAVKSSQEDQQWAVGAKGPNAKKIAEEEKKSEAARKKAEKDALLAQEELENAKKKPVLRQDKKAEQKSFKINSYVDTNMPVDSFSATGIDAALELLDVVDPAKTKSSDKLDRHPERRLKAGFMRFQEEQMPILKAENPKLRLSQLNEMLQKKWQV